MSAYKICPDCGAHLDPGEKCDCFDSKCKELFRSMSGEAKIKFIAYLRSLNEQRESGSTAPPAEPPTDAEPKPCQEYNNYTIRDAAVKRKGA